MIRVLVVGNVRVSREGLASLLSHDARLHVTEYAPGADGLRRAIGSVDVVVVDTTAEGGSEALPDAIGNAEPPIVALGAPEDDREVITLAELGVVGFVEREASLEELVASVVSAACGEANFPPRIATMLLRRVRSGVPQRSPDISTLTMRERQVVQLIAEGLSNKEIATRLGIEVATVKNHVHNILEKLDVSRRLDAVARLRVVENDDAAPAALPFGRLRSTTRTRAG